MSEKSDSLIEAVGLYGGHSARGNFDIELKVIFTEAHVGEALQFVAGIGQRLKMIASIGGEAIRLGTWGVYRLAVDRNAQTTVVFKTNSEEAFVNNLAKLMVEDEEITFKAKIISQ